MRLTTLQEQVQYDEDLKDRLRDIWKNVSGGIQGNAQGSGAGRILQNAPGQVANAFRQVKGAIQGSMDDIKTNLGIGQEDTGALTGKEREVYTKIDNHVKNLMRIQQTFRNGIQFVMPTWNPANRKYMGKLVIEDPEVSQSEIEAILQNPTYPIPQGVSTKKKQLLEAVKRFSTLRQQIMRQGVNDTSQAVKDGIQIRFDLGQDTEVFKRAVAKMLNQQHNDKATEGDIEELTPEETVEAIFSGNLKLDQLSKKKQEQVFKSVPLVKDDAPPGSQAKALAVAQAIASKATHADIANMLVQDDVIQGVNLDTMDPAMLEGVAKAMSLNTAGLGKQDVIKLIMTATAQGEIQNVGDLESMSERQIAALLERGRVEAKQMAEDQVDRMLDYYGMRKHDKEALRATQLQYIVAMKAAPDKLNPENLGKAMKQGLFSADDLAKAGISNVLMQKMLLADGQQIKKADRNSLISQLKSLESKAGQTSLKDTGARGKASPVELAQAISNGDLSFDDLSREEMKAIFNPQDQEASKAIDQMDPRILADIMPEVIDDGHLRINDASMEKLRGYLKGKKFQQRLSGSLEGLRQQAKMAQDQFRSGQLPDDVIDMAMSILSDGLKDEGEDFKLPRIKAAINKATKNLKANDEAFEKIMAMEKDDMANEIAKMGRSVFFQMKKNIQGQPESSQDQPTSTPDNPGGKAEKQEDDADPSLDVDANRTINDIIQQLRKWGQDEGPVKQRLADIARDLVSQGIKTNSRDFAQQLFNKYRQKHSK